MDFAIIPECYVDTKLIKEIVPPTNKNGYNHQKGCNTVINLMKGKLNDHFALGIVDKDKRELAYTREFELLNEQDGLELYKHREKHHYLILICPAIEKWILTRADESEITLTDFRLPNELEALKKITKTATSEEKDPHSPALRALFREFINRQNTQVDVLRFWVSYLKEHHYHADIAYLTEQTAIMIQAKKV